MKKRDVLKYLFTDGMVPVYSHAITGEYYPYDNRWNQLCYNDKSTRIKIEKSFSENPRKLTSKEEEKLLITGWNKIRTDDFRPEKFEIN